MRGLLDTSVLIALEEGLDPETLPDEGTISVVTLAELHVGVLVAKNSPVRARRLRTLAAVESTFRALPVDESVARRFAEMAANARRRGTRPKVMDLLIAATAAVHDLPLYSRDQGFASIPGAKVVLV